MAFPDPFFDTMRAILDDPDMEFDDLGIIGIPGFPPGAHGGTPYGTSQ